MNCELKDLSSRLLGSLVVEIKDPDEELPKIIQILSESGLHIQKIESSKSSLEDVFLDLTGKGINE